ncbi:MAG: TIGR03557 family F420-dependent LLM class oxidoreductase, partial [Acidimicrobiales bacterium]|nr:TIGR03557 family F420-dependent LLM class oxidoreductase [Acidimicrobiales bacterium]
FGLTLSSEEHSPLRLVEQAVAAEQAEFDFVSISDHYHPWIAAQGHASFVWSTLGSVAAATERIHVGVGVTCPIMRIHPAIIAQAVATTGCLLSDRFTFGVGSGEALNEHILGDRWPPAPVRIRMLEEAVVVIRKLLTGDSITHYGEHYTVEDARLFDIPDPLPAILMSAFGPIAAKTAADVADGLWITGTDPEPVQRWRDAGGSGPVWTQLSLCWDRDRNAAIERAHRQWPNTLVPGQLSQDLRTVEHFEQAVTVVTKEQIADAIPCGPDLSPLIDSVAQAIDAGIDHIYFHQIGDPTDGFIEVWEQELRPALREIGGSAS